MSTTPKGPQEEAGSAGRPPRTALDQTFLGVAPAVPVPAASPGKPAAPGGGSAIIAAPMISVSGDRARAPAATPAAPTHVVTAAPAAVPRAPLQGGWQSATAMPRPPGTPEQTMLQGTPPAAWATPAPAAVPAARAEPAKPTPPVVERSQPAYPAATAVQHTALASDYLRGARDAALGAAPARAPAPGAAPPPPPAPALRFHEAPGSVPAPATQPLSSEPPGFSSSHALHGPSNMVGGTQASVAPPLLDAPAPRTDATAPAWNASPAAPGGGMSPVPNAARAAAPNPMAGTMLEAPRSLPAPGPSAPPAGFATRFEQVPSARGAFSQQGPGATLPIQIDQSAVDWAQTSGKSAAGGANTAASSPLRLVLLAGLAVVAIGFAAFGQQLLGGAPPHRTAQTSAVPVEQPMPVDAVGGPDQALLSNRPAGGNVPSSAAVPAPSTLPESPPVPAAAPALPAARNAAAAVGANEATEAAAASTEGVPAAANAQAEAAATAESRLAAEGARHAIAGRYADALPIYRELARAYSQNTAYTAMAHVLEQKLGLAPGAAPAPAQP